MEVINSFRNYFEFLRNFYGCSVIYEDLLYPSSENAYHAAKIYVPGDAYTTNFLRQSAGFTVATPAEAKEIGTYGISPREDWDAVKDQIMYEILCAKFRQNAALAEDLRLTYPAILIEGNYWHDNYWGNCTCDKCSYSDGKNMLGKLLMQVRSELI